MTDTTTSQRPWNLTTIHRLAMESCKEGARLAAADPEARSRAESASELGDAFTGPTGRAAQETVQRLAGWIAGEFPDRWARGLEAVIVLAVEAALIIGARAIAAEEGKSASSSDDLLGLAEDELWLASEVDRLLELVIDAVVAAGHPLPGAQAFLDHVRPSPAPRLLESGEGAEYEVRTDWIPDADTGRAYQWGVRAEGDQVHVWRRRQGSRVAEGTIAIPLRDEDTLLRLLGRTIWATTSSRGESSLRRTPSS